MTLISLSGITKNYSLADTKNCVLKDISLTVNQGDMLAIAGASGSGKSTLMNIIGLLDVPSAGHYHLFGRDTSNLHANELANLRNHHIGFVFQQFNLLPRFNALQNVSLPLIYRNLPKESIKKMAQEALAHVGMKSFAHHLPSQLSGGQQQRVAIARALVGNPEVVLADEPTGALDSKTGQSIMALFLKLNQEGRTLILITHDKQVASQCMRQITLEDGVIIQESHA